MKILHFLLSGLLILLLLSGCKKDEIDNSDNVPALELTGDYNNSIVNLNWPETKVSSFVEYILVRSNDTIPPDLTLISPAQFVFVTGEYSKHEFKDENTPFLDEQVYYRLFANIGNRNLVSNQIEIKLNVLLVPFRMGDVVIDPEGNDLYFSDLNSALITKYDYVEEKQVINALSSGYFINRMKLTFHNGNPELYLNSGSDFIRIVNGTTLNQVGVLDANITIYDTDYLDGQIYAAVNSFSSPLRSYSRDNQSLSDTYDSNTGQLRNLAVIEDENLIIDVGNSEIWLHKFDDNGNLLEQKNQTTSFGSLLQHTVVSADGRYFAPYRNGEIFPIGLGPSLIVSNSNTFDFMDFAFAGDKLFTLEQSFYGGIILNTYSFPELIIQNSRTILEYNARRIFVDGNILMVLGDVFSNQGWVTIIDKKEI